MQLFLIRHAQSANNRLWDLTGDNKGRSHDPELTGLGLKQATSVAGQLRDGDPLDNGQTPGARPERGFGITHVYCSLMLRAVQTGNAVAEALDLPLIGWPEVHEAGGIYLDDEETGLPIGLAGNPRSFFEQNFPRLVLPDWLNESGWWNRDFESDEDRLPRGYRALAQLIERHAGSDDRVAVITHGGFYNYILAAILELPRRPELWLLMNNTGISRVGFEKRPVLYYHNRTDHLPREWVT
ncbi:fructose-2,6-bisphosphatase [Longilinea arvoryzae]|uniref:Fructose-2,6-bisphosphatase n=1 Tax=Longilinea arvoryzae TaxID=360412 RepID=A0A0K8MXW5_9CHLR|nr:histidine phosphatase family protein [Longilinea arvoryzae]GAP16099.1 fructose-2,6-bisphosphatase [Longilinea arvoryzae]